VDDWE
jgi:hypothetical protein